MPAKYNIEVKHGEDFVRNFHLGQGARVDVSAFAFVDDSTMKATSVGHNRNDGDRLVIVNSNYYNGSYTVAAKTDDTFNIAKEFEKTESKADWMDAYNLTGCAVEAKVWADQADAEPTISMTATIPDAAGGHIRISLTDTQVGSLDIGTYLWDLHIIDGSSNRTRLLEGRFEVTGRGT